MAKVSKDALRVARLMLRSTFVSGRLDADRAKELVRRVASEKPRGHLSILETYVRMLRLELSKSHAVVESAAALGETVESQMRADLRRKHGDDLEAEFAVNPELIGGMRVRVGSDVWDGSVRGRLARLADQL